jgi:penicillin amidase
MSTKAKLIVGSLGVLVVIIVTGFFFLRYQVTKSFPLTAGTLRVTGLQKPVTIHRDEHGVPRIAADNEHDMLVALGYVHAQDRLWQMDMARRVGEGRLSELLGPVTIPFDRMFRVIGIGKLSEEIEQRITPESRTRLESYALGVNSLIEHQRGRLPVEFDLLRYEPEPWLPRHSVLVARLMAWELTLSWWTDLTYGALAERLGYEKLHDILPPASPPRHIHAGLAVRDDLAGLATQFLRTAREFDSYTGRQTRSGGSNAWVLGPAKSVSGRVILANDTHLHLTNPSKWYEVHMSCPEYGVDGFSVPGAPGVVAGKNAHIAWGVTNMMVDDADFYIERVDVEDTTRYLFDGKWLPFTYRTEEIGVRDSSPVTLTIRSTHRGPVVTDVAPVIRQANTPFVASMRWTGYEDGDPIEAFHLINKATSWQEFREGVRLFTGPGQNFLYGDAEGNIGYQCGALLPARGKQRTLLPLPGWEKSSDWRGFVPFDQLPRTFNSPQGYIASANDRMVGDEYPHYISDLWEPDSRIRRLHEVLSRPEVFSLQDAERLQNDAHSVHARETLPLVLAVCEPEPLGVPDEEVIFQYLRNWDFAFAEADIASSIFEHFFVRLLHNIYKDEMGEDLFHDFVILGSIPIRVTERLLKEGISSWFDDVTTETVETRDDIIRKSMREAIQMLQQSLGAETKNWRWGNLHTVTLQHPFGLRKPLDRVFNIGPFPYRGGHTVVMSGEYSFNEPFAVTVGASFRQVIDFSRSGESRRVLTAGQSGQAFHKHYDDQTQLWLNGSYRSVKQTGEKWDELRLEPAP